MPADNDRRRSSRLEVVGLLPGSLELSEAARLLDVSPGGALVESSVRIIPGTRRTMRLTLGDDELGLNVICRHVARVIYGSQARYLVGFEFEDPPATLAALLR